MAVLIHERPDGELAVSECAWPEGVQSFNRILEEYYGDSPKSVWDCTEQENRGLLSAVGVAGDVVVLSSNRLLIGRDGITVVPEDGVPWLIIRRAVPDREEADAVIAARLLLARRRVRGQVCGGDSGAVSPVATKALVVSPSDCPET